MKVMEYLTIEMTEPAAGEKLEKTKVKDAKSETKFTSVKSEPTSEVEDRLSRQRRKTCHLCPPKRKRKTSYLCLLCRRPICLECCRKVCTLCIKKE
ncbi:unnamed protein product [Acanthoscelides obtectus]|uniref:Uncharacterized protein n=1 Tax=Acanthoscelides obtectus TaxID=200917 RepID=A0A9P0K0K8_ACAOB|nr:unnamed protein product [Acanthoscelides obtectus]CAK1669720.1 hypothetical protein AOBTE_LOCUS27202 [Acanthoscelides obtectus]